MLKLKNVLRCASYVSFFSASLFYITRKAVVVYALAMIINIYISVRQILVHSSFDGADEKKPTMDWILYVNMILPLLFLPTIPLIMHQTGLILQDNVVED